MEYPFVPLCATITDISKAIRNSHKAIEGNILGGVARSPLTLVWFLSQTKLIFSFHPDTQRESSPPSEFLNILNKVFSLWTVVVLFRRWITTYKHIVIAQFHSRT
mmetsp:Transcript_20173/g.32703  ORF Transcript_20173/g.32703 Transcript_20173/m.32703 type:complete len:105 (-) Transcript_20173:607-921(-)